MEKHPSGYLITKVNTTYENEKTLLAHGEKIKPLRYALRETITKQSRYKKRLDLLPLVRLEDYKANAVIDWVQFRHLTGKEHQATLLQSKLVSVYGGRGVFVTGPSGEKLFQGKQFLIRLQQPKPKTLAAVMSLLQNEFGGYMFGRGWQHIDAIEISIDFYPKSGKSSDRMLMTDILRRHIMAHPLVWAHRLGIPRTLSTDEKKSKTSWWISRPPLIDPEGTNIDKCQERAEQIGEFNRTSGRGHMGPVTGTQYIGSKEGYVLIRINDKITDRRKPSKEKCEETFVRLTPGKRRSRIEVELKRDACVGFGLDRIEDLGTADLNVIRPHLFDFRFATIAATKTRGGDVKPSPKEIRTFERSGMIGFDIASRTENKRAADAYMNGDVSSMPPDLGKKGYTVMFKKLNKSVDQRMRNLNRKWRGWKA